MLQIICNTCNVTFIADIETLITKRIEILQLWKIVLIYFIIVKAFTWLSLQFIFILNLLL